MSGPDSRTELERLLVDAAIMRNEMGQRLLLASQDDGVEEREAVRTRGELHLLGRDLLQMLARIFAELHLATCCGEVDPE